MRGGVLGGLVLLAVLGGPASAAAPAFDSGNFSRGQSFTWLADAPGDYTYHCNLHPSMEGTIRVAHADGAGQRIGLDIRNFTFEPRHVNVALGAALTWTNQDDAPHTVTAGTHAQHTAHEDAPRATPLPGPLLLVALAALAAALAGRR